MIRDMKSGQFLTTRQLAERLAAAPHVLVGKQRGNPDHHALQLWLLQALADCRPQGSLLLEVLTSSQQARVEAVYASIQTGNYPADLAAALQWQAQWDWSLYGPILRFALAQPLRLLAANLDPNQTGDLTEHMARLMLAAPAPAMLFAEAWRVRRDTGVPQWMSRIDRSAKPAVLMLMREGDRVEPGTADFVWYTAGHAQTPLGSYTT